MLCIPVTPPAEAMNELVVQPEHSEIGMFGFCARIAFSTEKVGSPGIRPSTMICGFAASIDNTAGVGSGSPVGIV